MTSLTPPPSPPSTQEDTEELDTLCDCENCVLCLRHKSSMYGKCYCNVIFSPRPVFMDFNSHHVSAADAFSDDQTSIEADNFLASLSNKRKAEPEASAADTRGVLKSMKTGRGLNMTLQ